jgi:hypothetical protein
MNNDNTQASQPSRTLVQAVADVQNKLGLAAPTYGQHKSGAFYASFGFPAGRVCLWFEGCEGMVWYARWRGNNGDIGHRCVDPFNEPARAVYEAMEYTLRGA